MADETTIYSFATPGGTITFNNGTLHSLDDLYWIQTIRGLDGVPLRAVIDKVPLGHGGLPHASWKDTRHFTIDGVILVQSLPLGGSCLPVRNAMENALRVAAESCIATAAGTLSWTPAGLGAQSLTVYYELLDFVPSNDYATKDFTLGLYATSPSF